MNTELVVVALVLVALGAVIATGGAPVGPSDEIDPANGTGIYLSPADTPNGDRYAGLNSEGELTVEVDVIAGTETRFDDVFTVSFEGTDGGDGTAKVWIGHENSDKIRFYRMDTGQSIAGSDNALELAPGESVSIGFVVGADSDVQSSFSETVTYRAPVPDADSGSSGGGSSGGSSGGGSGGVPPDDNTDDETPSDDSDDGPPGDDTDDDSDGGSPGEDSDDGSTGDDSDGGPPGDDTDGGPPGENSDDGSTDDDSDDEPPADSDSGEDGSGEGDEEDGLDSAVSQPAVPIPGVTLGGFFFRTLLLLVAFIATGAGTFGVTRRTLNRTESNE